MTDVKEVRLMKLNAAIIMAEQWLAGLRCLH